MDSEGVQLISELGERRRFLWVNSLVSGVLLQTLIPLGEELELHLFRTKNGYNLEIIPMEYKKDTFIALISIEKNPYMDIVSEQNYRLAGDL